MEKNPTYSIIMVVHNALEMVKISTLRTLRHSANYDSRLIVVDNVSTDGAQEWLNILAQRGDIDLIRNNSNIGHGPAIEQAVLQTQSNYIVTLDSDAFPLCDDWLAQLRFRLSDKVKITGILHHRDYIHPSCLMIASETIKSFNLSFLNEKHLHSRLDVAERMSIETKRRGYQIAGLNRTDAKRRGSVSEPVYLGSFYEGIVYHQWYTTRKKIAGSGQVDDVPSEAIERSLQELFEEFRNDKHNITVIIGIKAKLTETQRIRNVVACLRALNFQNLPRWFYRIIIVEQGHATQLKSSLMPLADHYIFAYNPGAYNRGWAFNIGASIYQNKSDIFCLMDADILAMPDFLSSNFKRFVAGQKAVLPYNEILYLDAKSSEQVIKDRFRNPQMKISNINNYYGNIFTTSQGGSMFVDSDLFFRIGGFDERFRGYGREDREFWRRLKNVTSIERASARLFHLDHPSQPIHDFHAKANVELFRKLSMKQPVIPLKSVNLIGNLELFYSEKEQLNKNIPPQSVGKRDWQNWHRWKISRIESIIKNEQRQSIRLSARKQLAEILMNLGDNLLDVGCGAGALWLYFRSDQEHFTWSGADITQKMLQVAHQFFPRVPICLADSGCLPYKDNFFDIVLLRHILEHLPLWLMENTISEALRVARCSVVIVFYATPVEDIRRTIRVGDDFLETKWSITDIEKPILKNGWFVHKRFTIDRAPTESDEIWIIESS